MLLWVGVCAASDAWDDVPFLAFGVARTDLLGGLTEAGFGTTGFEMLELLLTHHPVIVLALDIVVPPIARVSTGSPPLTRAAAPAPFHPLAAQK
jgi:hypothetical protein